MEVSCVRLWLWLVSARLDLVNTYIILGMYKGVYDPLSFALILAIGWEVENVNAKYLCIG